MSGESPRPSRFEWNTPLTRIVTAGVLILLLQIPIMKISGVVHERTASRDAAVTEVAGKWGRDQAVIGPYLALAYRCKWTDTSTAGKRVAREKLVTTHLLPESLDIDGDVRSEIRERGIFEVPVYKSELRLRGHFGEVVLDQCPIKGSSTRAQLERAELVLHVSDPRAIAGPLALNWDGKSLEFLPGAGTDGMALGGGIHANVKEHVQGKTSDFQIPLSFNGSNTLNFAPFAERSEITLRSDWPHPSFQGNWLPREHSISDSGFDASWSISHLGRDYPQQMEDLGEYKEKINASRFGVYFKTPVDSYSVSGRLVKYELLVLGLVFVTFWLFELLAQLRVHPVQYLLVGSAMCLFYLLQLSLAEHLGLAAAYSIASSAVITLVGAYCLSVLRSSRRAAVIGGVLGLLYGYLYVLLQLEDYALLVGAIGLFATLGVVMYLTRRIDWYRVSREPHSEPV